MTAQIDDLTPSVLSVEQEQSHLQRPVDKDVFFQGWETHRLMYRLVSADFQRTPATNSLHMLIICPCVVF